VIAVDVTIEVSRHQSAKPQVGEYGGYQVRLSEYVCGGIYADSDQHGQTFGHKAYQAAAAMPASAA
jgi:hypothetical protein